MRSWVGVALVVMGLVRTGHATPAADVPVYGLAVGYGEGYLHQGSEIATRRGLLSIDLEHGYAFIPRGAVLLKQSVLLGPLGKPQRGDRLTEITAVALQTRFGDAAVLSLGFGPAYSSSNDSWGWGMVLGFRYFFVPHLGFTFEIGPVETGDNTLLSYRASLGYFGYSRPRRIWSRPGPWWPISLGRPTPCTRSSSRSRRRHRRSSSSRSRSVNRRAAAPTSAKSLVDPSGSWS